MSKKRVKKIVVTAPRKVRTRCTVLGAVPTLSRRLRWPLPKPARPLLMEVSDNVG